MAEWCALKMKIDCLECGLPVMVDGPWQRLRCPHCHGEMDITFVWRRAIEEAMRAKNRFEQRSVFDTSNPVPFFSFAAAKGTKPRCTGCDAKLAVNEIETGVDGTIHCTRCGRGHETWPAPTWLRKVSLARQIFCGMREADQGEEPETAEGSKPIVLTCVNCSAPLRVTAETERVVPCAYCEVEVFLPAEIWHRLHPVRKRRAFWIRSRG
ncbi:MAG TPA: hypothetical protein RMH99_20500 [Sandaracinaceae bacterium LLY-WYZ-13_1]|nr:hypothetical protein [Sandaracinaceae bacterium LLY-WYZ-13_1]